MQDATQVDQTSASPRSKISFYFWLFAALVVVFGMAQRIQLASTALWIDELLTLAKMKTAHSVGSVLAIRHDNNHLLFSAILVQFNLFKSSELILRFPSLLASLAFIAGCIRFGGRESRAAAICCGVIAAFGGAFVAYGAQARGYGLMIAFAVWVLNAVVELEEDPKSQFWRFVYRGCMIFGLLSHLTMLHVFAGAMLFQLSGALKASSPTERLSSFKQFLNLNVSPILCCVLLYLYFIKGMVKEGGPKTSVWFVYLQSFSATLNPCSKLQFPLAIVCFLMTLVSVYCYKMRRFQLQWLGTAVISPLAIALLFPQDFFHVRYFLPGLVVSTVFVGTFLGSLIDSGEKFKAWFSFGFVTLFLAFQGYTYFESDRKIGRYPDVISLATAKGQSATVIYTGFASFIARTESYYAERPRPIDPIFIHDHTRIANAGFVFVPDFANSKTEKSLTIHGHKFVRVARLESYYYCGFPLLVFKRVSAD